MTRPARHWLRKITREPLLDNREVDELLGRGEFRSLYDEYPKTVAYRRVGEARSVYHGDGMDYEESRPYEFGDELRFMNWRLTARTGQFHMKVFRAERRPGIYILLDRRSSMRFGSRIRLKAAQAARIAILTAWTAHRNQSRVGAVILDPKPVWHEQSQAESSVLNMIQAMRSACPPLPQSGQEAGTESLPGVLRHMNIMLPLGSQVCLISDFSDLDENHRADLYALSVNHQVNAIHILDPAEMRLPDPGVLRFTDPDYHTRLSVDTADRQFREAYDQEFQRYLAHIREHFVGLDIAYRQVLADEDPISPGILP